MENSVLTIDQMKEIMPLNIDEHNTKMCWIPVLFWDRENNKTIVERHVLCINRISSEHYWNTTEGKETVPTLTLDELLDTLPIGTTVTHVGVDYYECSCSFDVPDSVNIHVEITGGKTALEAVFNMAKYCKMFNN